MKRPFFRTFFITVFHHRGSLPDGEFVVPSFGKTFYCLPNYNYLFVSFLIRFSMNNPGLPCGIPRARLAAIAFAPVFGCKVDTRTRVTLRKIRLCARSLVLGGLDRVTLRKIAYALVRSIPHPFARMLVGLSGLEPPTSRLSGGCSNQLSYKPM